jgi:hypothetical protein
MSNETKWAQKLWFFRKNLKLTVWSALRSLVRDSPYRSARTKKFPVLPRTVLPGPSAPVVTLVKIEENSYLNLPLLSPVLLFGFFTLMPDWEKRWANSFRSSVCSTKLALRFRFVEAVSSIESSSVDFPLRNFFSNFFKKNIFGWLIQIWSTNCSFHSFSWMIY